LSAFESSVVVIVVETLALVFVLAAVTIAVFRRRAGSTAREIHAGWRLLDLKIEHPIALALITLAGLALRLTDLWRPMGADESATFLYYASKPLLVGISVYGSPNNHLFHTALMHTSFAMFGAVEWALRLPALVAGVAMIPLTYAAAIRARLLACALVAGWPALIDYSTDGRGYTLLCCFVLVCAAAMAEVRRSGNRAAMAIFVISASLGFFTIPVMVYPFAAFLVWSGWQRRTLICAAATFTLTAVLYAPALAVSGVSAIASNGYLQPLPFSEFVHATPSYAASVWRAVFAAFPVVLQILMVAAVAIGLWRVAASNDRRVAIVVVSSALLICAIVAAQRVLPFPRVWLPFIPIAAIFAAEAIPARIERWIAAGALVALGTSSLTTPRLRETGELRGVYEIARELRLRARPGDPVFALPPSEMPLAFYVERMRVPVEVRFPDPRAPRSFAIVNRAYGQTLGGVLGEFKVDPRGLRVRRVREFGASALYELSATR
jgi:hypothetical protein